MITLIRPRWLIPIEPTGIVLHDHACVISQNAILALLPAAEAIAQYPDAEQIVLPDHALLPGFVNLHGHSAMSLLRGMADDLSVMDWLQKHIWPAEQRHISDEFVFDGTLLAMLEMLRGGTTTVNDMYFFHDAVARAALLAKMRTVVGCSILEFPTPFAANADEYLRKALSTRDNYLGEPLLGFSLAPHAPYTVSDATFQRVITLAEQLQCTIHCHIHESRDEIESSLKQYGVRPLERLSRLGLLGPNLLAAHMVHATEGEIALLARQGVKIAHNPTSNLKLASGIAPLAAMLAAGIKVGIGTDGAASNNKLDMLGEMRLAALLAKAQTENPAAVPAAQALEMATLGGAKALGMDDKIGSLKAGKLADIIAIDLSAPEALPCFDPISQIVYAAGREQVSHVWVNGVSLLRDFKLNSLPAAHITAKAHWWREQIVAQRGTRS